VIAQIDEQNAAVIALAVKLAGEADRLPDIALVELCTVVGTVGVHLKSFQFRSYGAKGAPPKGAPRVSRALTGQARAFVKAPGVAEWRYSAPR